LGALYARFVVFLVRNVAKRCGPAILGRTLTSVVLAKDLRDINDYDTGPKAITNPEAHCLA
jgi:hypothetical protein